MKKLAIILLVLSAVLMLAACANNAVEDMTSVLTTAPQTTAGSTAPTSEATTAASTEATTADRDAGKDDEDNDDDMTLAGEELLDPDNGKVSDTQQSAN